ncbi:MAG: hypothetical protein WC222_01285 [Parachlamydiales bacterium]|jgi:hypothetical protein
MSSLEITLAFPGAVATHAASAGNKIMSVLYILSVEAFAVIRHVIPSAIEWQIRKFNDEITTIPFPITLGKIQIHAEVHLHGHINIEENVTYNPFLFFHGDHSRPDPFLNLIKVALKSKALVYSVYIPTIHKDEEFAEQGILADAIMSMIEQMITDKKGIFGGFRGVGHSKGAMLLAERQFHSDLPPKILETFCIAGPLRVVPEATNFTPPLSAIFEGIYPRILNLTERKIVQIVPEEDWCAPYVCMAVRPHEYCYTVDGMHLSGLFSEKTTYLFEKFVKGELTQEIIP